MLSDKSILVSSTIASISIETAMPSLAQLSRATLSLACAALSYACALLPGASRERGKDGCIQRCKLQMMPRPRMRRSPSGKSKLLTYHHLSDVSALPLHSRNALHQEPTSHSEAHDPF